jgi:hypothetical protein
MVVLGVWRFLMSEAPLYEPAEVIRVVRTARPVERREREGGRVCERERGGGERKPRGGQVPPQGSHFTQNSGVTPVERRGINLKGLKDVYLEAKAGIWP